MAWVITNDGEGGGYFYNTVTGETSNDPTGRADYFGDPWRGDRRGWTPENIDEIFNSFAKSEAGNVGAQTLATLRQLKVDPNVALDALWNSATSSANPYWQGGSPTGIMREIWSRAGILPYVDSPQLQAAQKNEDYNIWAGQQQGGDDDFGDLLTIAGLAAGAYFGLPALFEGIGGALSGVGTLAAGEGALSTAELLANLGAAVPELGISAAPGIALDVAEYGGAMPGLYTDINSVSAFQDPLEMLYQNGSGPVNLPPELSSFPNLSTKDLLNIGKTAFQLINQGDSQSVAAGRRLLSGLGGTGTGTGSGLGTGGLGGVGGLGGINWLTDPSRAGLLTHGESQPIASVSQQASEKESPFGDKFKPDSAIKKKSLFEVAEGGTISPFEEATKVMEKLSPKFTPSKATLLSYKERASKPEFSGLSPLKHIYPSIIRSAKGGLPREYHEATPKGHDPEFITGLTGYYADGKGTGQSDDIPALLHDGDYVMDAETVSALGDGSSKAGRQVLEDFRSKIPHSAKSGGKVVPAKIADGEYVFPEAFVTALGKGDNKRGAEILDGMREKIRAHKRRAPLDKIPPKAKSPLQYMKA